MTPKPDQPKRKRVSFRKVGPGRPPPGPTDAEIAAVRASGATPREMASAHVPRVLAALLNVAEHGQNSMARVGACKLLLSLAEMPEAAVAEDSTACAETARWEKMLAKRN